MYMGWLLYTSVGFGASEFKRIGCGKKVKAFQTWRGYNYVCRGTKPAAPRHLRPVIVVWFFFYFFSPTRSFPQDKWATKGNTGTRPNSVSAVTRAGRRFWADRSCHAEGPSTVRSPAARANRRHQRRQRWPLRLRTTVRPRPSNRNRKWRRLPYRPRRRLPRRRNNNRSPTLPIRRWPVAVADGRRRPTTESRKFLPKKKYWILFGRQRSEWYGFGAQNRGSHPPSPGLPARWFCPVCVRSPERFWQLNNINFLLKKTTKLEVGRWQQITWKIILLTKKKRPKNNFVLDLTKHWAPLV